MYEQNIRNSRHARREGDGWLRRGRALPCLMLTALSLGVQGTAHGTTDTLGARLVQGYIRPATTQFAAAGQSMVTVLREFCAQPDRSRTTAAGEAFQRLVWAWSAIDFLRFGPLVEANRYEKIFFWPDPRGVTLRQTQAVIGKQDKALLEADALRAASVAVQGLPSLELALYAGDAALLRGDGAADYRCRYAVAVAGNVAALGAELARAWSPQGETALRFIQPADDNPLYRSEREVAAEAIKALSGGLQFIRDAKLTPALGASAETARAGRMPWSRSGLALPAMAATLRGMAAFAAAGEFARSLPADQTWMAEVLTTAPLEPAARLEAVALSPEQALADGETRAVLAGVALRLKDLTEMVNGQIASALGVSVGFNALDGD